ncbi:MAG: CRISPR-associated endonuclease Cas1 [Candidatus Kryptoniota bacterium]
MKRPYYIFSSGRLARKENTVFLYPSNPVQHGDKKAEINTQSIQDKQIAEDFKISSELKETSPEYGNDEKDNDQRIGDVNDERLIEVEETESELTEEDIKEDDENTELTPKPKKVIPVEDIESIYIFGEISFNTKFLTFASQNQIPIHVFNYYGYYSGSYYPREFLNSGFLLVKQVEHYVRNEDRMRLARKFVIGAAQNLLRNLKYYNSPSRTGKSKASEEGMKGVVPVEDKTGINDDSAFALHPLTDQIDGIESLIPLIEKAGNIQELMAIEGNIRQVYYAAFEPILGYDFEFKKRIKRPPNNAVNALISFGNSMVYTAVLGEIYKTQLSPLISYLHEPGERRFSLALDIAEIFKPILADRTIFKVLNKRIIQENDFDKRLNYAYLKEGGRKSFVKEFDERLQTTIQHRGLRKSVSYRSLIRLECYKLVKHLLGEKEYEPFQIWW